MGRPNTRQPMNLINSGGYGAIWLSDEAKADYDELLARSDKTGIREATTIARYFERFADLGPEGVDNPKMFKPVGRFKDGAGKLVQVFEFKAYQWRVYGVRRDYAGSRCFLGFCTDASKKQNKADRALLERCARMSSEI